MGGKIQFLKEKKKNVLISVGVLCQIILKLVIKKTKINAWMHIDATPNIDIIPDY